MSYQIGIDIGGTNTDAVLIDEKTNIIAKYKTATTSPLEIGFHNALENLLLNSGVNFDSIQGIFVGTTHTTNALLENNNLYKVGVIRIAGHQPNSIRTCFNWPKELVHNIYVECITINGGYECDGRVITPFNRNEAKTAALKLVERGAESIAIIGVFSPIIPDQEIACAHAIQEVLGEHFPFSLSYKIGGIGFIERENSTILNCALKKPISQGFNNLEKIKLKLNLNCSLHITQNDGSIIKLQEAINDPLLTISSGPTNSFIGASKLVDISDAIVVDIGGTSTDIGMIMNGYPKRSMHNVQIGGINLNFRMPDVLALAIGGGSYIKECNGSISIGPQSCGRKLTSEALIFGGSTLTLSDIACKMGFISIPHAKIDNVKISDIHANNIFEIIKNRIQTSIKRMRGNKSEYPVIAVGGGAPFLSSDKTIFLPKNFDVANAYGAALAEISGTVDTVVSLENREATLNKLKEESLSLAIKNGAYPTKVKIVDLQIIPYHYMPNHLARIIVKSSGPRK